MSQFARCKDRNGTLSSQADRLITNDAAGSDRKVHIVHITIQAQNLGTARLKN